MSDDLYFQVFYGSENVRYDPEGVDLSEFNSVRKKIPRASDRTWGSISNWILKAFGLNRDEHEISVMTVVNRRNIVCCELLPLEGTRNWRNYVIISTSQGLPLVLFVQAFEKIMCSNEPLEEDEGQGDIASEDPETMHEPREEGGEIEMLEDDTDASHEPREATGEADEGEDIPGIVEEFEREGEEYNHTMDDDFSNDDDDYHIPQTRSGLFPMRMHIASINSQVPLENTNGGEVAKIASAIAYLRLGYMTQRSFAPKARRRSYEGITALRQEMEANLEGPLNDPTRCVADCKVWPKGVEPPDCYCHMRCVLNIFREYETFGLRYWSCKNIEEVQKSSAISQQYLAWLKKVDDDVCKSER
ncbi:hypothetical protein C2845_PM07G29350 [Panicum miliaceum]|uniref:Transposase MuDR N-terminal domain-containing protein n=1 Tax=Panicum miliaceum TaxID=4540 RepID=A0A3L6SM99_PANMI|nr:hypothetical protein C2845_PM07G29350 [Panicum miliaceum]